MYKCRYDFISTRYTPMSHGRTTCSMSLTMLWTFPSSDHGTSDRLAAGICNCTCNYWSINALAQAANGVVFTVLTHTRAFNGLFSRTTRVSRNQKGKTSLDFTEARDSEWQWHQLDHMQVCTWLQTDNHASTPPLSFFTGRMPFLPPNQQRQSTEGIHLQC